MSRIAKAEKQTTNFAKNAFIMKRLLLIILIVITAFAIYWLLKAQKTKDDIQDEKLATLYIRKNSPALNASLDSVMMFYKQTSSSLIEENVTEAAVAARQMINHLNRLPVQELGADTLPQVQTLKANIKDINANAESLIAQTSIAEMRKDFNMLTQMMYPTFFQNTGYEGNKFFVFDCTDAFGNESTATWLSDYKSGTSNPYTNTASCGLLKDSVGK